MTAISCFQVIAVIGHYGINTEIGRLNSTKMDVGCDCTKNASFCSKASFYSSSRNILFMHNS